MVITIMKRLASYYLGVFYVRCIHAKRPVLKRRLKMGLKIKK
ncbi:hypothetical protein GPLA_1923 [Paraglaciecola polaris LMG 21857]|uniref:Uncharacterized protein n=1 Tax=Paraglaciecola polaris LMG 21857 TaxID=1129793 RepID=K7ABX2_9ALTE|nr:hypothetical protein GPLA_1923 [Paraglaciecola polaris LMG 21857]